MIGLIKQSNQLIIADVPKTNYYEALMTDPMETDQLIEVLIQHGCHQVDIADAFHALELGWNYKEGEWVPPEGSSI